MVRVNSGTVGKYATFEEQTDNGATGVIGDYATLRGSFDNFGGTIGDHSSWHGTSENVTGTVGNVAAFNGNSFNNATCGNDAVLNSSASQHGTFSGDVYLQRAVSVSGATVNGTIYRQYNPSHAGDQMDLVDAPNAVAITAIQSGLLNATGTVIDGKTIIAALEIIAAAVAGKISGAGTGTEAFKGLDGSTTRAVVTVDSSGNRSAVSYP